MKRTKDQVLTDAVWIFIKNKVHSLFPNTGIRRKAFGTVKGILVSQFMTPYSFIFQRLTEVLQVCNNMRGVNDDRTFIFE